MKRVRYVLLPAIVALALLPGTAGAAVVTQRASVSSGGVQGNGRSFASSISADGRFVAFQSRARNLDAADVDVPLDVYVRDTLNNTTLLASRASGAAGAKGNGDSYRPSISGDGRFVAFHTSANNLDPADADSGVDIYVRDTLNNTTLLASRATGAGGAKGNSDSYDPEISADGRFVVFRSSASNLDPDATNFDLDVYVRDTLNSTTLLVSRATGAAGAKGNGDNWYLSISADGRFVAFESDASNLDPADVDIGADIYVRDTLNNTTLLASRASGAAGAKGNGDNEWPSISADGRFVSFSSPATNLDPADADGLYDAYVRDTLDSTTLLVSRTNGAAGAKGNNHSGNSWISADGRFVAFNSLATNLGPGDADGFYDIYVRDVSTNATALASRSSGGIKGNGDSLFPSISAVGHVAFESDATNLVAGDTNAVLDVFVATEPDGDLDGVPDASDNCPAVANATGQQDDTDGDLAGDACDGPGSGNVDCSPPPNGVNSVDALKVLRANAALTVAQSEPCLDIGLPRLLAAPDDWKMGDVDCSGGVSSVDALKILRAVAGLSVAKPVGCPEVKP